MNKKMTLCIIVVLFLALIFLGGSITSNEDMEVGADYDTSFYVEDTKNLFIKIAKLLDQCCFFVVDIVINGISSVFELILGF